MMRRALIGSGIALALLAGAAAAQSDPGGGERGWDDRRFRPAIVGQQRDELGGVRRIDPLGTPQNRRRDQRSGPVTVPVPDRDAWQDDGSSFIDRAFGLDGPVETVPLDPARPAVESAPLPDFAGEDELPRFRDAPLTTRSLFGPGRPEPVAQPETTPLAGAEIRQIDKMTGTTRTLSLEQGAEVEVGRLRVALETCRAPEAGGRQGTMAYLRIWDPERQGGEPVFAGWMFAESPALSGLDHPRYDLWLLGCVSAEVAAPRPRPDSEG